MTLRSSQSSNSTTSTGSSPSEDSTTLSATPDSPAPTELALTPSSPLLGDLQEIPDRVSATTGTPSPTPSEAATARSRSSCASLFSQVGNASSITPSPRQHESPHSDTDHDNPRRSRPPSPDRALTPLPPLLGSTACSPSQSSRDATIPSATSEEESPPEGSRFSSRLQQDPDTARATQRTSQQGAPQQSLATAQEDPQASPSARSITHSVDSPTPPTSSEGLSIDDAGGESQDPAPQTRNSTKSAGEYFSTEFCDHMTTAFCRLMSDTIDRVPRQRLVHVTIALLPIGISKTWMFSTMTGRACQPVERLNDIAAACRTLTFRHPLPHDPSFTGITTHAVDVSYAFPGLPFTAGLRRLRCGVPPRRNLQAMR
ncbi:hypothetical protein HPB51_011777 [Rhipicephalus microplus]|uniref:Uncharacterized protein n=1 Tax=Rhipicephalus microplus TaxID=6941 RepID=A0A9J6E1F5_RHIMP|nr:hypothetical protein HPB51_011777 [Rhipicephalus microplus]